MSDSLFANVLFLVNGEGTNGAVPTVYGAGVTRDSYLANTTDLAQWGSKGMKLVGNTSDLYGVIGSPLAEWTFDGYFSGETGHTLSPSNSRKLWQLHDANGLHIEIGLSSYTTPHSLVIGYTNTATGFSTNASVDCAPNGGFHRLQMQRTNGAAGRKLVGYLDGVKFLDVAYATTGSYVPALDGVKFWDEDGVGHVFDDVRLTDVARYVDGSGDRLAGPLSDPTEGWPTEGDPATPIGIDAALVLGALHVSGAGAYGGQISLAPLTGSGAGAGFGALVLGALTVRGTASRSLIQGGELTLTPMTASGFGGGGGELTLAAPVFAITATAYSVAAGDLVLAPLMASGTATASEVATGALVLGAMTGKGFGGGGGQLTLAPLLASGGASLGRLMTANLQLAPLTATGTATHVNAATGALVLAPMVMSQPARGALVLPALQASGTASRVVVVVYEGYAVNLNPVGNVRDPAINEATHYTRAPFEALVRFNGQTYGLGAAGIHRLGGDTDAGAAIAGDAIPVLHDWGSPGMKRPEYVYLGGRVTKGLRVKLRALGERGETLAYDYENDARGPDIQNHRQKLGRGLRARYLAFGVGDPTGGAFVIDTLEPQFADLTRRVSSSRS